MKAKIYKPAKNAMQSGRAKTKKWVLEFYCEDQKAIEPLMGWTSSSDTKQQLKLSFPTLDNAVTYAKNNHMDYVIIEPNKVKLRKQSYADNFLGTTID